MGFGFVSCWNVVGFGIVLYGKKVREYENIVKVSFVKMKIYFNIYGIGIKRKYNVIF